MKAFITGNATAEVELDECLDCIGNNTEGYGGFRDKIKALGLDWTESKVALKKTFTKEPAKVVLNKTIETVDFEAVKAERYVGLEIDLSTITRVNVSFDEITFKKKSKKKKTSE